MTKKKERGPAKPLRQEDKPREGGLYIDGKKVAPAKTKVKSKEGENNADTA